MKPIHVDITFWLLVFGGLIAGIGFETDWGRSLNPQPPKIETVVPGYAAPVLIESYSLKSPDAFLETALRPIIVITRRPAPPPPPPPPPEAPKPRMNLGQFVLTGTTIIDNKRFAYLFEKSAGKVRVVAEGSVINGILVKEVRPTGVSLTQYEDSETLPLQKPKP